MSLPDPKRLPIGPLAAPYSHLEITGPGIEGGQGTVYSVFDTRDRSRRALKVLHREQTPHGLDLLTQLHFCQHVPSELFTRVYDVIDLRNDPHYRLFGFTMDFVDCNLAELLERAKSEKTTLPEETVSRFIRQLAAAIDYLQQAGRVHRDLKPANLGLRLPKASGPLAEALAVTRLGESVMDFRDAQLVVLDLGTIAAIGSFPQAILIRPGDRYKHQDLYPAVGQKAHAAMDLYAFARLLEDFRGLTEADLSWLRDAHGRCLDIADPLPPGVLGRLVSSTWQRQSEMYARAGYREESQADLEKREWAFEAFKEFRHGLQNKHGGAFLIHGPAGCGKSTLLRQWSHRLGQRQGYYFQVNERTRAEDMVASIIEQLEPVLASLVAAKRPEAESGLAALAGKKTETEAGFTLSQLKDYSLNSRLHVLIERIMAMPQAPALLVLFIDAIDETQSAGEAEKVIQALPKDLKPNVFLVLSSRPPLAGWEYLDRLRSCFAGHGRAFQDLSLDPSSEGNKSDVTRFVARQLGRPEADGQVRLLAERCGHLFLLASFVVQEIRKGLLTLEKALDESIDWMKAAPSDRLKIFYQGSWDRITGRHEGAERRLDLLANVDARMIVDYCAAMLCVLGKEGIDEATLCRWLKQFTSDKRWIEPVVHELNRLFIWFVEPSRPGGNGDRQENPTYRVRHKSIRDFLTNGAITREYVRQWHKNVTGYYLDMAGYPQTRRWADVHPYGRRHVVTHLLESLETRPEKPGDFANPDQWHHTARILTDWAYLGAALSDPELLV